MANVLLAWDNAVVDALSFYNDGYGTYTASLNNMGKASLGLKWVSPGLSAANTRFTFTFAGAAGNPSIKLIALCSHNLTLASTIRVRASTVNTFASTVYDSGTVNVYPGAVTEADRVGMRQNWWLRLPSTVAAQYWRVDVSDAANPAGYVSVGRLFGARGLWQPTVNMLVGAGLGWESNSDVQRALNGAEWFTEVEAFRIARYTVGLMPAAEVLSNGFDLARCAAGHRREVLFVYDPADAQQAVRRSFLGRFRSHNALTQDQPLALKAVHDLKELI